MKTITWIFLCAFACATAAAQMALPPEPGSATLSTRASRKAVAENKFYVKAYGFYGLLTPGGFSGQGVPPAASSTSSYGGASIYRYITRSSDFRVENSFGAGLRVGGGVGMVLNDFINVGIDGEYLMGNNATESYNIIKEVSVDNGTPTVEEMYKVRKEYSYRVINIIPNITFKAVSKSEYYIYNRLCVCIGIPTQLSYIESINAIDDGVPYMVEATTEFDKTIGLGYQAALGVQFRLGERLRGFAEIVVSSVQINVNSKTLTNLLETEDGTTQQIPITPDIDGNDLGIIRQADNLNLKIPVAAVGIGAGIVFRF